ncbi:MAG: hypothetical protein SFY56_15605 [Bacteroidota bacterium]|nr:hypothetical protein [Bacteroidota bacterium]
MRLKLFLIFLIFGSSCFYSQNDIDAIRYSRNGVNGTSRFVALGGAFGAIGADLTCGAYNPAGLGLYRKGDIAYSGCLRTSNNKATINNTSSTTLNSAFAFNNFGISTAWASKNDKESRNVIAFSTSQVQNFSNQTKMISYTNKNSIAKDMLNLALSAGSLNKINSYYEGIGYDTFLLDYDSLTSNFFSFLDINKTVKQTRSLVTSGKVNDVNFSYAYSYKDQYYFGLSIGVPKVEFISTTSHVEIDDKDSMKITMTSATSFTSTYSYPLPFTYTDKLGFNSLTYTEYFKTTGRGVNLKIGGIVRVGENLRIGAYYHSPTIYNLTDIYYNELTTTWDADVKKNVTVKNPENNGTFSYKITTPSRISLNAAYVFKKMAVLGVDYEFVNYSTAALSSTVSGVFDGVNAVIKDKYKLGQNLRIGAEINVKPVIIRLGYNMLGSPFGEAYNGILVRHTPSLGFGLRNKNNLYLDVVWLTTITNENYFLFTTLDSKALINYRNSMLAVTIGIKF